VVYHAGQLARGRAGALKVLRQKRLLDDKPRRRFEREAKAAAKLHHTNIVPVFGVGEYDGLPYYVMQFIQGLGLDEVIEELKRLRGAGQVATPPPPDGGPGNLPPEDVSAGDAPGSLLPGPSPPAVGATVPVAPGDPVPAVAVPPASSSGGRLSDTFSLSSSSAVLPGQGDDPPRAGRKKPTYWQSVAHIGVQ